MTSVLVLDDRPEDRELLSVVLRYAGHTVHEAPSGDVALALAHRERPDLIIADLLMPLMDGYEFVHELRRDPETAAIPVIFCTATYEQEEVTSLAAAGGVARVLTKPVEPADIIHAVEEVLGTTPAVSAATSPEAFKREHERVLNAKLLAKVDELERASREQQRLQDDLLRSQRATAESLILLETLQQSAPVGIAFLDREFRIQRINEKAVSMRGLQDRGQLIGRTVEEVAPELWRHVEWAYRHVLETGEAVLNVDVGELNDDDDASPSRPSVLSNYYPVRLDGEIIGIGVIVVDITERREADALRSAVMDTMAEGLYVMTARGG